MPQPGLSWVTQYKDQTAMGDPYAFRGDRNVYNEVSDRYPVSPTIPRQQVPLEEQMAMDEFQTQQQARQVNIRGQLLNQRVTQQQLDYDNRVINQAEEAQPALADLTPGTPDYEAQKALFLKTYPLAAQNQALQTQLGRLDQTHAQQMQANEILKRQAQDDDAREQYAQDRMAQSLDAQVAAFGPAAMKVYQDAMKVEPGQFITPEKRIEAFSKASGFINQMKAEQERQKYEDRPMTPQQVQREISSKRAQRLGILRTAGVQSPADLTGDLADDYNAISQEIVSLQSNPSADAATGTPVKTMPIQSLFPKPSTKTGP